MLRPIFLKIRQPSTYFTIYEVRKTVRSVVNVGKSIDKSGYKGRQISPDGIVQHVQAPLVYDLLTLSKRTF